MLILAKVPKSAHCNSLMSSAILMTVIVCHQFWSISLVLQRLKCGILTTYKMQNVVADTWHCLGYLADTDLIKLSWRARSMLCKKGHGCGMTGSGLATPSESSFVLLGASIVRLIFLAHLLRIFKLMLRIVWFPIGYDNVCCYILLIH